MNIPKHLAMFSTENEISFTLTLEEYQKFVQYDYIKAGLPKLVISRNLIITQCWTDYKTDKYYTRRLRFRKEEDLTHKTVSYTQDTKYYFTVDALKKFPKLPTRYELRAPMTEEEYQILTSLNSTKSQRKRRTELSSMDKSVILSVDLEYPVHEPIELRVEIEFADKAKLEAFKKSEWMLNLLEKNNDYRN